MPDHSPSTDERASVAQLSQSSLPLECTSHLGFGLEHINCRTVTGDRARVGIHRSYWSRYIMRARFPRTLGDRPHRPLLPP